MARTRLILPVALIVVVTFAGSAAFAGGGSYIGPQTPSNLLELLEQIRCDIQALEGKLDNASSGLSAITNIVLNNQSKLNALECKLDDETRFTDDDELAGLLEALTEQHNELDEGIGHLCWGQHEIREDIESVESKADYSEVKLDGALEALNYLLEATAALENKADSAEGKLDGIGTNTQEALERLAILMDGQEYAEAKLDGGLELLNYLNDAVAAVEGKTDGFEAKLDGILDAVYDNLYGLSALQQDVDAVETKLDDNSVGLDALKNASVSIESKIDDFDFTEIKYTLAALESKSDDIQDGIGDVLDDTDDIGDDVTLLLANQSQLLTWTQFVFFTANDLKYAVDDVEGKLDSAGLNSDLLSDMASAIDSLEGKLDGGDGLRVITTALGSIETKLDGNSLPQIGLDVENILANVGSLEGKMDALSTNSSAIASAVANVETKLDTTSPTIGELVEDNNARLVGMEVKLDGLDLAQTIGKDVEDLVTASAAIEGKLDALAAADPTAALAAIEGKLDEAPDPTAALASIEVKLDGLDLAQNIGKDVEDLVAASAAIEGKLDSLEAKLDDPEYGLEALLIYLQGNNIDGVTHKNIGVEVETLMELLTNPVYGIAATNAAAQTAADILCDENNFVSDWEFNYYYWDVMGDVLPDPDPTWPCTP